LIFKGSLHILILTSIKIPQVFPLVALLGFSSVREKEKGLKPPFHCLRARNISLTTDIILQIPTVGMCEGELRTRCSNIETIQRLRVQDRNFNEMGLSVWGKKENYVRGIFLSLQTLLRKFQRCGYEKMSSEHGVKISWQSNS